MKRSSKYIFLGIILSLGIYNSCKKGEVPELTTSETTNITGTSVNSGGFITSEGSGTIVSRGVCWSTTTRPDTKGSKTVDGAGAGSFESYVSGLAPATEYFLRAYATNDAGTGYGMTMSFTTLGGVPITITYPATILSTTSVVLNGQINPNHITSSVTFEYGTTTGYGNSVAYPLSPVTGSANKYVNAELEGLLPGTSYHYRIKAVNSLGTMYGEDMPFTTFGRKPTVKSSSYASVSATEISLRGIVNPNYLPTVVTFEYGTTTDYGTSVAGSPNPLTGNMDEGVDAYIPDLNTDVTYHYRLKAVNELGITYSEDKAITISNLIMDIDGNAYQSVIIGSQEWMVENLRTTHFNYGTEIANVTDDSEWATMFSAAYCWYQNNGSAYKNRYGALYNWYAVQNGNLCPSGWHVPSDGEWAILENYLSYNGYNYDGEPGYNGYAKSLASETGWTFSETTGSPGNTDYPDMKNRTGFTALPGGVRDANQRLFGAMGMYGIWWTSTQSDNATALDRGIDYSSSALGGVNVNKASGFSVRCLKD